MVKKTVILRNTYITHPTKERPINDPGSKLVNVKTICTGLWRGFYDQIKRWLTYTFSHGKEGSRNVFGPSK